MPNQLSMASNCPGEMVVRMRYVLTTPDWFHLAFCFGYLFQISGEFISCFKVFSASYNRKQSNSSAFFSSGPPMSPHQNANLVTFFFFHKLFSPFLFTI